MTDIYHLTQIANLPTIIQEGCLWCETETIRRGLRPTNIGYEHIKERRRKWTVEVSEGGVLGDYVPFYFGPRSPMLYTISRGNVPGYTQGQNEILHLVANAEKISRDGLSFTFTDGHAVVELSRFFADLADFDKIDWEVMRSRYWNDTLQDPDRCRRRQAEFLIYLNLPWNYIQEIGVRLVTIERQVIQILDQMGVNHQPRVIVRPEWYY